MVTIINIAIGAHVVNLWRRSNVCRSAPNEDGERARDILGLPVQWRKEDIRGYYINENVLLSPMKKGGRKICSASKSLHFASANSNST